MTSDSFLALTCAATIALMFGSVLAFSGYRFFIFLLPIWGFFWGFGFGAQSIQAIFGGGFLADISSWVVGFFVGLIFAAISYLFFAAAVAILAASLGYTLGVGIMLAIGFDQGFLAWGVGIVMAVLFIAGTFYLSLYKWLIILSTSISGATVIVGTFLLIFGKVPTAQFVQNPVKAALNDSPLWWLIWVAVAVLGFAGQAASTRNWTLRGYNRYEELTTDMPDADLPAGSLASGMAPAMEVPPPADTTS